MSAVGMKERLQLPGMLRLGQMAGIQCSITEALSRSSWLELHLDQGARIEFSFIQLVESARRRADAQAKRITMSVPASGILLDMLERGGFLGDASPSRQFWLCTEEHA